MDDEYEVSVVAMSDRGDYDYPPNVAFEITQSDPSAYRAAAEYINRIGFDVLSVQHEYGIYGGASGAFLLDLLREVTMPIVPTLHTVLQSPSEDEKFVMDEMLALSERIVVMSNRAIAILQEVHGISPDRIDLVPHGIPSIDIPAGTEFRSALDIDGPMLLTFGLLSPDKGIHYVIEAMPAILQKCPGATYLVVGATHPNVRASVGETYRESLVALAEDLGVASSVRFIDRFVSITELVRYLAAMDIYLTPYLNPKQITSGTLAYAVGAGKAVISTPYIYAEELLADSRGLLVPFRDADAIADAVVVLQSDPIARKQMGRRAAEYGKQMLWPAVARNYVDCFEAAKRSSAQSLASLLAAPLPAKRQHQEIPLLKLDHLFDLTDDTGILQHATFCVPNRREGYCVDDNARALLYTTYLESLGNLAPEVAAAQSRYLSFVDDAFNPLNGRFRNFMSFRREWLESEGSEDSQGRSLWALGAVFGRCRNLGRRHLAANLFERALPTLFSTRSPRTWAYCVLGASEYLRGDPHRADVLDLMARMSRRLGKVFDGYPTEEWFWCEASLTYANARIPQALIVAGDVLENRGYLATGLSALTWLMERQTGPNGVFQPVGTNGHHHRGKISADFDQQPVEAHATLSACLAAFAATRESKWLEEAHRTFSWFLGANVLGQPLYDEMNGGCFDGLHEDRVNRNQGAESCLSFLCSQAELFAAGNEGIIPMATTKHELI